MFLPLYDDNSRLTSTPVLVYLLIAANAAIWFAQMQLGENFSNGYACVPYEITHHTDLIRSVLVTANGQTVVLQQAPGPHPIWLTIFTAMFMHGSWMHIIGNMLFLWIFGDQIEDLLGKTRFVLFYLACGIAAAAAQILYAPDSKIPCLGASGAIAGVLGAYLLRFPTNPVHTLLLRWIVVVPAWVVLGEWIVLQFISQVSLTGAGEATGVAYMAHIGGFIAGVVLSPLLAIGRKRSDHGVYS